MAGPERIGRYRVSRLLGSGGFASVWLGTDDTLDQPVAIKVLAENWANVPDVHHRFLREAILLRTADSDRVVRMYDIGELDDARPYFVMSYADRGTLADRLTAPLSVPQALHLAIETARAVAVLHHLGVVHRDIKPSNVLLQTSPHGTERVLIGDLGVAKNIAHAGGHTIAAGTPGYMAPEQTQPGPDIDPRADVYGLGALTYHLLTNTKYPGNLRDLRQSKRLKQVLARALAADRDRRWPDAVAFADALVDVRAKEAISTPSARPDETLHLAANEPTPPDRTSTGSKRRSLILVAVAACLALVGGVVATTLSLGHDAGGDATGDTGSGESGEPTTRPPGSEPPARPPRGPLEITFAVDAKSGYRIDSSGVEGPTQWANLTAARGRSDAQVTVYGRGDFDPATAQDGVPINVAGREGFYDKALPDPGTGESPATRTAKPAAAVQYADDAWYVVQTDLPAAQARKPVSRIAAAVRFGKSRQLRFPVRFGHLPAPLRACGGLDGLDPAWRGPWNAWVDLCDDTPGTSVGPGSTPAVRMMMNDASQSPGPTKGTRINGRLVEFDSNGAIVDCGGFVLSITVADNHEQRYDRTELRRILQGLAVRDFAKKARWFPADVAVPHG